MNPHIKKLVDASPYIYTTDQCHIVDTQFFPKQYFNEDGVKITPKAFFNGSVVGFKNRIFFCCRADQPPWFQNIRLVFCELDQDFIPIKKSIRFLEVGSDLDNKGPKGEFHVEDPRLFVCGGKLHLVYGDGYEVYHATFDNKFKVEKWRNITNFSIRIEEHDGREKNWAPFDYEGYPNFIYSDNPRVIWNPFRRQAIISNQNLSWDFGSIRGGTPAIPYKDKYITFFHSAKNATDGEWRNGRLYYMGAYTFESKPPFRVTHITKTPLMRGESLYDNLQHPGLILVVFPAGVIESQDSFFVSMGINDSCNGILRIGKTPLENALTKL